MFDKVLRQIHIQINLLNKIATTAYQQGQYKQGLNFAQQACKLIEINFNTSHPEYGNILNTLAVLYKAVGDFQKAKFFYQQTLDITKKTSGKYHFNYAVTLSNFAGLYEDMGDFQRAEELYQQALEVLEANQDTDSLNYADIINNLAGLYWVVGRLTDAEILYWKAQKITGEKLSMTDPSYACSLNNLAALYCEMGDFEKAESLLLESREILGDKLGIDHPDYATTLNNLAWVHYAMHEFQDIESLYTQVLEIWEVKLSKEHPNYAASLNNWAILHYAKGDFQEAESLYRKCLEINEVKLGIDHPRYGTTLTSLAGLQAATDRSWEALCMMQEAAKIQNRILGQIFSISSDYQRLTYLQQNRYQLEIFLSLVVQYLLDVREAVQAAFDLVLRRKALGAEVAAIQRTTVLSERYHHLVEQLNDLQQLDTQIASLAFDVSPLEHLITYKTQLANLYQQRDELDRKLSRQIPEMNLQKQLDTADRSAIAKALPDNAILVEFVRFDVFNFKAVLAKGDSQWLPARYLAFILPANQPEQVQMVDLGEAEPIDQLIRKFRKSIPGERDLDLDFETPEDEPEYISPQALELRQKLFDPLKPYLEPQQQLFLAPDGELTCLPFGVLPTAEGRYLMQDYAISYLSVGRDVLRFNFPTPIKPTEPLVIANPDYNLTGEATAPNSDENRQLYQNLDARNSGKFSPLPATGIEGERVAKLLGVKAHTEAKAVKSLVSHCQSPQILHVATHGCFLEDIEEKPRDILGFKQLKQTAKHNPLLRSFLAFAGANTVLQGGKVPPEAEDGLLTAQSASGLNLAGTALVVTSACQTALGNVLVGEGVFGLRRALMLAGAQTLVMSLWSVPDVATAILMERFYHHLLKDKMGRAKALEQAQFYVRDLTIGQMRQQWLSPEAISWVSKRSQATGQHLRDLSQKSDNYCPYAHPMYWGAFICQGNPTPL